MTPAVCARAGCQQCALQLALHFEEIGGNVSWPGKTYLEDTDPLSKHGVAFLSSLLNVEYCPAAKTFILGRSWLSSIAFVTLFPKMSGETGDAKAACRDPAQALVMCMENSSPCVKAGGTILECLKRKELGDCEVRQCSHHSETGSRSAHFPKSVIPFDAAPRSLPAGCSTRVLRMQEVPIGYAHSDKGAKIC